MDGDRKYRQHGYQDSGREPFNSSKQDRGGRQGGPKPSLDITGPRLPRLVQNVASARCYSCAVMLSPDLDYTGICPKCSASLHCCKQCVNFDSSTRFQCLKPIPVRIAAKDQANTCDLFRPRVTVARDGVAMAPQAKAPVITSASPGPRNADDARAAFNSLFKK
jgi:hypothetical protein